MSKFSFLSISIVCLSLLLVACGGGGGGGGSDDDDDGDGIVNSNDVDRDGDGLIEVGSLQQLDWIRHDLQGASRHDGTGPGDSTGCPASGCRGYELIRSLDFDTDGDGMVSAADDYYDYDGDGSNNGWLPIGTNSSKFAAIFEGNGRQIANLFIDRSAGDLETSGIHIGLFGVAESPAVIRNLDLTGSVVGHQYVAALMGRGESVDIAGLSVDADVSAPNYAASLVALHFGGLASDVQTGGNISGLNYIGGVTASATSTEYTDVHSNAQVDGNSAVGGLMGYAAFTTVDRCSARGPVSATSNSAGGLVGWFRWDGSIIRSFASGAVASGSDAVGGLVGLTNPESTGDEITIASSYATGDVTGVSRVGGLVGVANPDYGDAYTALDNGHTQIRNSFATGNVVGTGNYIGGLVGFTYDTTVTAAFSSGDVSGARYVGGFVGDANNNTRIELTFTTSNTTGTQDVGAFVGWSDDVDYFYSHYEIDGSGLNAIGTLQAGTAPGTDLLGANLAQLQCPTAPTNATCAAGVLYNGWASSLNEDGQAAWNFGNMNQLPGLLIDGAVYRDSDGDGALD